MSVGDTTKGKFAILSTTAADGGITAEVWWEDHSRFTESPTSGSTEQVRDARNDVVLGTLHFTSLALYTAFKSFWMAGEGGKVVEG